MREPRGACYPPPLMKSSHVPATFDGLPAAPPRGRGALEVGLLALLLALGSPAQPAGQATPTPAEKALLTKTHTFLEGLCRLAPDRRITEEFRPGSAPPGFRVVKYKVTSTDSRFALESGLLVTTDGKWAFLGRALALPPSEVHPSSTEGQEALSRIFSKQAGYPVKVAVERKSGTAGTLPARIDYAMPIGTVRSSGAVPQDGRWFLLGTFLPLGQDPRKERMQRLSLADNPTLGPADAPVTVVEMADFSCHVCAEFHPRFEKLVAKYPGKVRLVHMDFPHWQSTPWSMGAALWARCVAAVKPEVFWPFASALFAQHQSLTRENLDATLQPLAEGLGVDPYALIDCSKRETGRKAVLEDLESAMNVDLLSTPTVLVNGTLMDRGFELLLEPAVAEAIRAAETPPKKP